jgi:hypothetical protein
MGNLARWLCQGLDELKKWGGRVFEGSLACQRPQANLLDRNFEVMAMGKITNVFSLVFMID